MFLCPHAMYFLSLKKKIFICFFFALRLSLSLALSLQVSFQITGFYVHFQFAHKTPDFEFMKTLFTLEGGGKVGVSTKGKCD